MYKKYIELFLEENEKFEIEYEQSQKNYKLINDWSLDLELPEFNSLGDIDILPKKRKESNSKSYVFREHNLKTKQEGKKLF